MAITLLRAVTAGVLPVLLSIVYDKAEKRKRFASLPYGTKQLLIGVSFGLLAVLATESGVPLNGAVFSVRDAAPLTAGLAKKYDVSEINLVDSSGIITASTYPDFVGYDMANGQQSAEFLPLLSDTPAVVQSYQPTAYDPSLSRKYAGIALENGGFLQVATTRSTSSGRSVSR